MEYHIQVNDTWIHLVHLAVNKYIETWPGGDPGEQQAYLELKTDLDKLHLETMWHR